MVCTIVLTGGPGAGKTSAARALCERYPGRVASVPEAATQIYRQLQTRWTTLDDSGRRDVQRRIYALQVEQERRLHELDPDAVLILDRGTVDGAAYWPDGPEDYWRAIGTTHEAELVRYDAVIWLQSCAALGAYDGERSNPWRSEDASGAIALDRRLAELWRGHPKFREIQACSRFDVKVARVCAAVDDWLLAAGAGPMA